MELKNGTKLQTNVHLRAQCVLNGMLMYVCMIVCEENKFWKDNQQITNGGYSKSRF